MLDVNIKFNVASNMVIPIVLKNIYRCFKLCLQKKLLKLVSKESEMFPLNELGVGQLAMFLCFSLSLPESV